MRRHQRASGLWGQIVDDPESWDETSASAMFAYALQEGLNAGLFAPDDAPDVAAAVDRAFRALVAKLDVYGNLADVCAGTGWKNVVAAVVPASLSRTLEAHGTRRRPRVSRCQRTQTDPIAQVFDDFPFSLMIFHSVRIFRIEFSFYDILPSVGVPGVSSGEARRGLLEMRTSKS